MASKTPSIKSFFLPKTAGSSSQNLQKENQSTSTESPTGEKRNTDDDIDNAPKRRKTVSDSQTKQDGSTRSEAKKLYETTKRVRVFLQSWKKEYPWVAYDDTNNVMYCEWCRKHPAIADKSPIVTGTSTFRHDTLRSHDGSSKHVLSLGRVHADADPDNTPLKITMRKYATKVDQATEERLQKLCFCNKTCVFDIICLIFYALQGTRTLDIKK